MDLCYLFYWMLGWCVHKEICTSLLLVQEARMKHESGRKVKKGWSMGCTGDMDCKEGMLKMVFCWSTRNKTEGLGLLGEKRDGEKVHRHHTWSSGRRGLWLFRVSAWAGGGKPRGYGPWDPKEVWREGREASVFSWYSVAELATRLRNCVCWGNRTKMAFFNLSFLP